MRILALLPLAAAGLAAQDAHHAVRIPREPSTGIAKSVEALPIKDGQPAATGLTVPADPAWVRGPTADRRVADAAVASASRLFDDPDFVAFDTDADGTIWAAGGGFKAAFDAGGWRFIGRPQPAASDLSPIAFRVVDATVGGAPLDLHTPARSHHGRRVEYEFGDLREALAVAGNGVEQTFVFERLPQRGELVVAIAIDTALTGAEQDGGVRFSGSHDDVRYSAAVAIDADGNRVAAPTRLADGRITIRVPAEFVAHATLPLVIDPWVTAAPVINSTNDVGAPDIAWDETGQVWAITFMRLFGGSDWDCYVQRMSLGNPMNPVGGVTTIDISSQAWTQPHIANLGVFAAFMVVCQARTTTSVPWTISGRIMANSGGLVTPQFLVASSTVDELHPDIAGDAAAPPAYFTVVWEHAHSASDHDIYARQVEVTGALRGTGPTFVQTNTLNQSWPSISKSAGGSTSAPSATERLAIVYQQTFSAIDQDIYGALLTWDGVFVPVNGNQTFTISTLAANEVFPTVSTPTLADNAGDRLMLAVWEKTNINNGDIAAACFDQDGLIRASASVTELEQNPVRLTWPQARPSVDTDGRRFVVGYHEVFNNNTSVNDLDTRVTVLALAQSGLFAEEAGTPLGFSNISREFNMQLTSRYSGTGVASPHFNTTHDRDGIGGGGFGIDAYSFDLVPFGRYATRSTACGSLAIAAMGQTAPGGVITLTLNPQPPVCGFVLGNAVAAPIGPCPSCTLGADGFVVLGPTHAVLVPANPAIVGAEFSAQGFVFEASGAPCLGQIQLSDTVDVTIG